MNKLLLLLLLLKREVPGHKFPKIFPSCVLLGPINSVANDE